jgi:hypothetical protein
MLPILRSSDKYFILNYFSNISIGTNISRLFPPKYLLDICMPNKLEFEQMYLQYILNDKDAFTDFMEIMMANYYNENVTILTDFNNEIVNTTICCIIKLIQQRYGYSCFIINDLNDLLEAKDSSFSDVGIQVFLKDKEMYIYNTVDPQQLMDNLEVMGIENDKHI